MVSNSMVSHTMMGCDMASQAGVHWVIACVAGLGVSVTCRREPFERIGRWWRNLESKSMGSLSDSWCDYLVCDWGRDRCDHTRKPGDPPGTPRGRNCRQFRTRGRRRWSCRAACRPEQQNENLNNWSSSSLNWVAEASYYHSYNSLTISVHILSSPTLVP